MYFRILERSIDPLTLEPYIVVAYWPGSAAAGQPVHIQDFRFGAMTWAGLRDETNAALTPAQYMRRLIVLNWRRWRQAQQAGRNPKADDRHPGFRAQAADPRNRLALLATLPDEAEEAGE